MFHFLYKTTNVLTGRYYIGVHSTCDLNDGYLGSGTLLKASIRKYGRELHFREILEFAETREEVFLLEKQTVNLSLLADPMCLNLAHGGRGPMLGLKHSDAAKQLIAKAASKSRKGTKMSATVRILFDRTGTTHTLEAKQKIGEASSNREAETWLVRTPANEIIEVTNLRQFCIKQGLGYTTMHLSLKAGRPTTSGRNIGWQLLEKVVFLKSVVD